MLTRATSRGGGGGAKGVADTYKKMGSSASAIEYENTSQNAQRELLALKGIQGEGYGPPKFSLETRTLTVIHSNAHLL